MRSIMRSIPIPRPGPGITQSAAQRLCLHLLSDRFLTTKNLNKSIPQLIMIKSDGLQTYFSKSYKPQLISRGRVIRALRSREQRKSLRGIAGFAARCSNIPDINMYTCIYLLYIYIYMHVHFNKYRTKYVIKTHNNAFIKGVYILYINIFERKCNIWINYIHRYITTLKNCCAQRNQSICIAYNS